MSLSDGLLLDNLLQTVMQQDVWLANRTDGSPGQGVELDPFSAAGSAADADPPFDKILRNLASAGNPVTVRLLPGTYYTRGFHPTTFAAGKGWKPFSGLKIVGTSLGEYTGSEQRGMTCLKLCTGLDAGHTVVIGGNPAALSNGAQTDFITGFELSDLIIDANWANTSGQAQSGIGVFGKNIFLSRVRVTNFGTKISSPQTPAFGISIAQTQGTNTPENCVIDSCIVDSPKGTNSDYGAGCFGIYLASLAEGSYHHYCVVRNSYVDMDLSGAFNDNYTALGIGGGIGTIVENNRFLNCKQGIKFSTNFSSKDLIIRHNYFRKVQKGGDLLLNDIVSPAASRKVGRLVFLNNIVEWALAADITTPHGVLLDGTGTYEQVIIRDNLFRRMSDEASNNQEKPLYIGDSTKWVGAIVDNNIGDVGTNSQGYSHPALPSGAAFTPFNNLQRKGTLVQGYNRASGTKDQELTTEVEDVILGL